MAAEPCSGNPKPEILDELAQYELALLDINNTVPKGIVRGV